MVNDGAIASVPIQTLSDLGSKQMKQGKERPYSLLVPNRTEQIKLCPLSLSDIEKCSEAPWKSSRIWKQNGSQRMTEDYRELFMLAPLSMLCTQLWSVRGSNWYNWMEPFHAILTLAYIWIQYLLSCKPLGLSNTCLEQMTFRVFQQDYLCDPYLVWDGPSGCCLVLPILWKKFCYIADIMLMNSFPCFSFSIDN